MNTAFETKASDTLEKLTEYSEIVRREGMLHLGDILDSEKSPLLRNLLQLVVDGTDPDIINDISSHIFSANHEIESLYSQMVLFTIEWILKSGDEAAEAIRFYDYFISLMSPQTSLDDPGKDSHGQPEQDTFHDIGVAWQSGYTEKGNVSIVKPVTGNFCRESASLIQRFAEIGYKHGLLGLPIYKIDTTTPEMRFLGELMNAILDGYDPELLQDYNSLTSSVMKGYRKVIGDIVHHAILCISKKQPGNQVRSELRQIVPTDFANETDRNIVVDSIAAHPIIDTLADLADLVSGSDTPGTAVTIEDYPLRLAVEGKLKPDFTAGASELFNSADNMIYSALMDIILTGINAIQMSNNPRIASLILESIFPAFWFESQYKHFDYFYLSATGDFLRSLKKAVQDNSFESSIRLPADFDNDTLEKIFSDFALEVSGARDGGFNQALNNLASGLRDWITYNQLTGILVTSGVVGIQKGLNPRILYQCSSGLIMREIPVEERIALHEKNIFNELYYNERNSRMDYSFRYLLTGRGNVDLFTSEVSKALQEKESLEGAGLCALYFSRDITEAMFMYQIPDNPENSLKTLFSILLEALPLVEPHLEELYIEASSFSWTFALLSPPDSFFTSMRHLIADGNENETLLNLLREGLDRPIEKPGTSPFATGERCSEERKKILEERRILFEKQNKNIGTTERALNVFSKQSMDRLKVLLEKPEKRWRLIGLVVATWLTWRYSAVEILSDEIVTDEKRTEIDGLLMEEFQDDLLCETAMESLGPTGAPIWLCRTPMRFPTRINMIFKLIVLGHGDMNMFRGEVERIAEQGNRLEIECLRNLYSMRGPSQYRYLRDIENFEYSYEYLMFRDKAFREKAVVHPSAVLDSAADLAKESIIPA